MSFPSYYPNTKMKKRNVVETLMGYEYFDLFYNFFANIIRNYLKSEKIVYVVLITRRCACLANIFLDIIKEEYSTEEWSHLDDHIIFMTQGSLTNRAYDLGKEHFSFVQNTQNNSVGNRLNKESNKKYPDKIIIMDDSLSYGRVLNNILSKFEEQFEKGFLSYPDNISKDITAEHEIIQKYMLQHIQIRIGAIKGRTEEYTPSTDSLLDPIYASLLGLKGRVVLPPSDWNDLSKRLSLVVNNTDVVNAAFILSAVTDFDSPTQNPRFTNNKWYPVKTNYQNHEELVYFYPIFPRDKKDNRILAIGTVRRLPCSVNFPYRWASFVFMPKLSISQLERLERHIYGLMNSWYANIITGQLEDYEVLKRDILTKLTLSSRMEFVSFFISYSLLCLFEDESEDSFQFNPKGFDFDKVQWNFDNNKVWRTIIHNIKQVENSDDRRNARRDLIFREDNGIQWVEEIFKRLDEEYQEENPDFYIIKDKENVLPQLNNLIAGGNVLSFLESDNEQLNQLIENALYNLAIENEKMAHQALFSQIEVGNRTIGLLNSLRFKPFETFLIDKIAEMKEKLPTLTPLHMLAVILQMMDAGLMSIVSSIVSPEEFSLEKAYVSHQLRICEEALSVLPTRCFYHCKFLAAYESQKKFGLRNYTVFLEQYVNNLSNQNLIINQLKEKEKANLRNYIEALEYSHQSSDEWNKGLMRQYKIVEVGNGVCSILSTREILQKCKQFENCIPIIGEYKNE